MNAPVVGGLDVVFENDAAAHDAATSGGGGGRRSSGGRGGGGGPPPISSGISAFGNLDNGRGPSGAASAIGNLGPPRGNYGAASAVGGFTPGGFGNGGGGDAFHDEFNTDDMTLDPTIYSAPGIMVKKPDRILRQLVPTGVPRGVSERHLNLGGGGSCGSPTNIVSMTPPDAPGGGTGLPLVGLVETPRVYTDSAGLQYSSVPKAAGAASSMPPPPHQPFSGGGGDDAAPPGRRSSIGSSAVAGRRSSIGSAAGGGAPAGRRSSIGSAAGAPPVGRRSSIGSAAGAPPVGRRSSIGSAAPSSTGSGDGMPPGRRRSSAANPTTAGRKRRRSSAAATNAAALAAAAAKTPDRGLAPACHPRLSCCGKRTYGLTVGLVLYGISALLALLNGGGNFGRTVNGYAYVHGLLGGLGGGMGVEGWLSMGGQGSNATDPAEAAGGGGLDTGGSPTNESMKQKGDAGDSSVDDSSSSSSSSPGAVALPPLLGRNYGETSSRFPKGTRQHVPVFWSIPRSGNNVILATLGGCLRLVVANELGGAVGFEDAETLQVYRTSNGISYANVDPTTVSGLRRAQTLGLASSQQVDVVFTPLINMAASVFSPSNPGRIFALFRHPVERAASRYQQLRKFDPRLRDVSIEEWAEWDGAEGEGDVGPEDEWMTKSLLGANEYTPPLTDADRDVAFEMLRRKVLVGLADDVPGAVGRFEGYYGWNRLSAQDETMKECRDELMGKVAAQGESRQSGDGIVEEGSPAWKALAARNQYDLEVFEYAGYLYRIQAALVR